MTKFPAIVYILLLCSLCGSSADSQSIASAQGIHEVPLTSSSLRGYYRVLSDSDLHRHSCWVKLKVVDGVISGAWSGGGKVSGAQRNKIITLNLVRAGDGDTLRIRAHYYVSRATSRPRVSNPSERAIKWHVLMGTILGPNSVLPIGTISLGNIFLPDRK